MSNVNVGDISPLVFENEEYKNKKVILYFYSKDNTAGCTDQACNLRDNYEALKKEGFEVVGISPDNEKSHVKFKTKNNIPFELLSDESKEMSKKFGVLGDKKIFGKVYEGIMRTTFIIAEDGKIENIIDKVKVKDHSKQILDLYKK